MSKETLVFTSGILLIIVPFLGIPLQWREYIIAALGALLTFIGYALRRGVYLRNIEREGGERATDSFVETTNKLFEDNTVE